MILSSRILRTITLAACTAAVGIAAIAPSAATAADAQQAAIPPVGDSPRQVSAVCQGEVYPPTGTMSGTRRYVDFHTWVECITVNVGIEEIRSWIRLEFYFNGPSGRGQWLAVTAWRVRYFPGASETKFPNPQSWECEGAYYGQFRAQAYAKAYLSDGAVIRFPQGGGYTPSTQVGVDC
jgi:hypothetical protein